MFGQVPKTPTLLKGGLNEEQGFLLPVLWILEDQLSEQMPSLLPKLPSQHAWPTLPTQAHGRSSWMPTAGREGAEMSRKHFIVL